ncbi:MULTISPECIES: hypothetical protein [Corynebacterium]|uniref:hypothetical protein n=1 Tax=Corynebacterium TaxID=1716 RepID=UPI00257A8EA4|nr:MULTISPECIES: hypothetical protein [Corynebacterium]
MNEFNAWLGLFLSAVTVRFGSIWPAVFGHGLPLAALNPLVLGDPPASSTVWTASALSALLLFGDAYFFARGASPARPSARTPISSAQ